MGTDALKVKGINHVVLHVRDMEQSLAFYRDLLGFETRNISSGPGPKRSFLRCGGQGLDLFEVDEEVHAGKEMNHMALNLEAAELSEILEQLAAAGVTASEPTRRNTVFISDPDGHQIEMLPLSANERSREREAMQAAVGG